MGEYAAVAGAVRQLDRIQGLAERADLVDLDQERIRDAALDAFGENLRVGHEQIVADQLHPLAERPGERLQPSQSSSAMPSSIERIG